MPLKAVTTFVSVKTTAKTFRAKTPGEQARNVIEVAATFLIESDNEPFTLTKLVDTPEQAAGFVKLKLGTPVELQIQPRRGEYGDEFALLSYAPLDVGAAPGAGPAAPPRAAAAPAK